MQIQVSAHLRHIPEAAKELGMLVMTQQLKTAETVIEGKSIADWLTADDKMHAGQGFGRSILRLE